jgi:hypothetical protein
MSVKSDVRSLIARLSPEPVCDDCLAKQLHLTSREQASRSVRELAGTDGFERTRSICSLCGENKLVVHRRSGLVN